MSVLSDRLVENMEGLAEKTPPEVSTKFPKNDPVAANLTKVIQILNKHNLTEGLDLRYLRESVGFESGAGRKLKANTHLSNPEKTDPDKEIQKRIRPSKAQRKMPLRIENDGSYLGVGNKKGGEEMSDPNKQSITELVNHNIGSALPMVIGDFSDVRCTSSRLSGLDINLNRIPKNTDIPNTGNLTKASVAGIRNTRKYTETSESFQSLDVQRVQGALGSGLEESDLPEEKGPAPGPELSATPGDMKHQKLSPTNSDKGDVIKEDLPVESCHGDSGLNVNNHGNKDVASEVDVKEKTGRWGTKTTHLMCDDDDLMVAPASVKSGVEDFRVFYWKVSLAFKVF